MFKSWFITSFILLAISAHITAQSTDALRAKILQITSGKQATVGVSIIGNDGADTLSINGDLHCPLQSVFKFHIAIFVLSEIDKGKFSLKQKVEIQKKDLLPGLWSPLREKYPEGGKFTIAQLIHYAVTLSDNVACDALLRLVGGPQNVEDYFRQNKIRDLGMKLNEERMQANRDSMILNWTTPKAASQTLNVFFDKNQKFLSAKSYKFIWKTMKATDTGQNRLKGGLPNGTLVAHKTGSSGTSSAGITEATNDIGIVFLPKRRFFIISVFVTQSAENDETNEKLIADIARATWENYTGLGNVSSN